MVITSDIILRGREWSEVLTNKNIKNIFPRKDNSDEAHHLKLFILATSIGIRADKIIEKLDSQDEQQFYVPRNILQNAENNGNINLDFMFTVAVLSSKQIDKSETERLQLAFEDVTPNFNKLKFLTSFANYGITQLAEWTREAYTTTELMDTLINKLGLLITDNNLPDKE